jgi:hypothetical protein
MLYTTYTHLIQGNSKLLEVRNQIDTLTLVPSFGHNLCYKYSNGSCEPILDIYFSRTFQWYKEFFNPMSCDPSKLFFENLGIHRDSNSQNGRSLGSAWAHSLTFSGTWVWFLSCTLGPHLFKPLPWSWTKVSIVTFITDNSNIATIINLISSLHLHKKTFNLTISCTFLPIIFYHNFTKSYHNHHNKRIIHQQ